MTTIFLVIGGLGLLLLAASLLFGSDFHVGHMHFDLPGHGGHGGHADSGSAFSLPSVAGFVGAFGFAATIASVLLPGRDVLLPSLIGLAAAVPTAWVAARLTRAAMGMATDATPEQASAIGALGVVVQEITADGYGEVRVQVGGQHVKFHARAATPLPAGAEILVIDAPSATSVIVEPATPLLGQSH